MYLLLIMDAVALIIVECFGVGDAVSMLLRAFRAPLSAGAI